MAGFLTRTDLDAVFGRKNVDELLRTAGDTPADQTAMLDRMLLDGEAYVRRSLVQGILDDPEQSTAIKRLGVEEAIFLVQKQRGLGVDDSAWQAKELRDKELDEIRNRKKFAATPENQTTTDRGIVESGRATSMASMRNGYF